MPISFRMKLYSRKLGLGLVLALMLASCSNSAKDTLGLRKSAPDEFRVIAKSPLSIPPNFSLRPPLKNASVSKESGQPDAKETLLGQQDSAGNMTASPGEENLLGKARVKMADPSIRQVLEQDNMPIVKEEKPGFFKKILPSNAKEEKIAPDNVVDPAAEKARLEQNKKEGKSVTEGETPTITSQPTTLDKLLGKDKKEE